MDDQYDELCAFSNIRYTPAWYYKQFPGFFNVDCYKILAKHTQIVPLTPVTEEPVTPSSTPLPEENKKRGYEQVEHS
jgi:hypothetical protein